LRANFGLKKEDIARAEKKIGWRSMARIWPDELVNVF
jgi:hypothetical protein